MSNETLLLLSLQSLLGLLTTIGLRWTASIKGEVTAMNAEIRRANEGLIDVTGRISHAKSLSEYHLGVTNSRLERVGEVASELRRNFEAIKTTIDVCPNCPHPNGKANA
jgi:hypothetical protein